MELRIPMEECLKQQVMIYKKIASENHFSAGECAQLDFSGGRQHEEPHQNHQGEPPVSFGNVDSQIVQVNLFHFHSRAAGSSTILISLSKLPSGGAPSAVKKLESRSMSELIM